MNYPDPYHNDPRMPRRLRRKDYTVGWICALPVELAAARTMLDEEHKELERDSSSQDENAYCLGSIGGHNVVIVCLPAGQIGNNSAATVAARMKATFRAIQIGLMVGIGGGVPSAEADIRLGDVVVSQPQQTSGGVIQYDLGKSTPDGFQRTGSLNAPPQILLGAVAMMQSSKLLDGSRLVKHTLKLDRNPTFRRNEAGPDVLFKPTYNHLGGQTCNLCNLSRQEARRPRAGDEPVVHYGTIASGNQVIRDGCVRDKVSRELGGVLCFEMEAAALMNSFPCLVIRGICDYADSHKNKRWQPYAAGTAAACAKEILLAISPVDVAEEQKPKHEAFSTVPFRQDPDFVDRPDILTWIRERCATPASRAALVGLGGVGKSQLAIQYCHDVRAASSQTWVFWVHAGTAARFEEAYRDLANRLDLPGRNDPKTDVLKLVWDWLCDEANGRWVMVLDNVDDVEVFYPKRKGKRDKCEDMVAPLATYLPQSRNGSILVTSRSRDAAARIVGGSKHIKEVDVMDSDQAVQLLWNKLDDASDEGSIASLARALDYVPLAIDQAAAYINRGAPRVTVSRYLDDFWRNDRKRTSLLNRDAGDLRRDESASSSVLITWQMSFEQIREKRPSAADLLSLMSFFNPQGIPESILRSYSTSCRTGLEYSINDNSGDDNDDDDELHEDLATLRAYSLVTATVDSDVSEMHYLVQFCTRLWLSSLNEAERWKQRFFTLMAREFPTGNFENWGKCRSLFPHVESLLEREPSDGVYAKEWAEVSSNVAWYMWSKGKYEMAERLARKAVRVRKRTEGQDSVLMLVSVSILALILRHQGKYEEAEEIHRRALEGYERALGKEHPDTLTSVSNLALVLRYQGKYEEAEEMNRRALEGSEKALGKEHPDTLTSLSNLALVLQDQGKYKEAEEMNWRVLEGREKALGKEHPGTLASVDNLAGVLRYQGKYEEAEEMNRRALEGYEKALGKEHPDTLTSVSNLAMVLQYQGKYEEAEEMNRRALEGREKALGKEHPDTLTSVSNLAGVLQYQGKYEEAEEMNRRALEGYEKALGEEHPNTLTSVSNLAMVLQDQEKYEDAEEMNRRALEGSEKALGKEHPDTLTSVSNLALVLQRQGKYKEAEEMNRRALEGYEKALGKEHPNTLTSVDNLALVLQDQGKYKEAEEMNWRALEGREKALGKEHPGTLASVYCLAFLFHRQKQYQPALEMYQRANNGFERMLGSHHPTTVACARHFSSLRQEMEHEP
ncbi:putative kinesin [Dendryphion nanum]|uniref:Kinesin n=1 Tax=Dendryphion nanum TaxID=256645 RepID=A0A9P9DPN4_9PLEO|nr:putative kinesin [Dendryphion nanum]